MFLQHGGHQDDWRNITITLKTPLRGLGAVNECNRLFAPIGVDVPIGCSSVLTAPEYGIPTRPPSLPEAYRWRFGEVSLRTFLPVINQSQTTRLSSLACKALEAVFPCGLPGAGTAVEALAQSEGQELVRYSRTAFWSFDKALRVRVHLH